MLKVQKMNVTDKEMRLINKISKRELNADEVYTFSVAAADDQIDRDMERFSVKALEKLSELFVGTPIIFDHDPKAGSQSARVYAAHTEKKDGVTRLICQAYMLKENNSELIAKIEGGILKAVSVGCAVGKRVCSVCGKEYGQCRHLKGRDYGNGTCHFILDEATDAYEISFVAVPAQRNAGVIKCQKSFSLNEGQADSGDGLKQQELTALRIRLEAADNELKEFDQNGNE